MRLVVAITGASGAILGIRLAEELKKAGVEVHLILSRWAKETIEIETGDTIKQLEQTADRTYSEDDQKALISSGSYKTDGMVIIPCSMKTLAAVAHGFSHNLIARAADVTLKENRKLVLVPRETPLHSIHLRNMLLLSDMGAVILPPNIAFYTKPQTVDDVVNHIAGKVMDIFGIENNLYNRWM